MSRRWAALLLLRAAAGLLIRTYFDPDEFWQSSEVAYHIVYVKGQLTWEWRPEYALRGALHPLLIALVYALLRLLRLDTPYAIIYAPRVLQGALVFVGDVYLWRLAQSVFGSSDIADWATFCHVLNWFGFVYLPRTYSNSCEAVLTTIALYYWHRASISHARRDRSTALALVCAALSVLIRPTSAATWLYLGINRLLHDQDKARLLLLTLLIGACAVSASLLLDYQVYGKWTLTIYNFAYFNVFMDIARFYGEHGALWYVSVGVPVLFSTMLVFVIHGVYLSMRWYYLDVAAWIVFVYSLSAHKEFRFIMSLLPILMPYAGVSLSWLWNRRTKPGFAFVRSIPPTLLAINACLIVYFAQFHQRAPISFMSTVTDIAQAHPKLPIRVDIWNSCHATPAYAFLHNLDVKLSYFDCSPIGVRDMADTQSGMFLRNPKSFLSLHYKHQPAPDVALVCEKRFIDNELESFTKELELRVYKRLFHSLFDSDCRYMLVLCKNTLCV